jgi:putative serine protease PepD
VRRFPLTRLVAAAVIVTVAVIGLASGWRTAASLEQQVRAQQQAITALQTQIATLQSRQTAEVDWSAVAAAVEPSVFTIETGDVLGSAWVAHADANGSDLVTNYHVVAEAYSAGTSTVQVKHKDSTITGTIVRVDPNDDLAIIHVAARLTPLTSVGIRPKVGARVMAVGSPLGLDGTISVGVVSGYRSLEGSDYMQFSAPISPGNSGGPVVDDQGHVLAVASAKLVGTGVEALSLGIPVQTACGALVVCDRV